MKLTARQQHILEIVSNQSPISISEIKGLLTEDVSQITINRDLAKLVKNRFLEKTGKGRSITYSISGYYKLFKPVDMDKYFEQDVDNRNSLSGFNHDLISVFKKIEIFTPKEKELFSDIKKEFQQNVNSISPTLYKREMERLTIELSWKSAQIEGNTYSLLETEKLFLEKELAKNKSKEDATMLLNHKEALDFLLQNKNIAMELDLRLLEEVHSLLVKDLGVGKNIRSRAVGITGTAYKPLDNVFQIRENLAQMAELINAIDDDFEKAFLAILIISYIQPFEDGNKRTGRMIGNAILINAGACPLSYRSVDSIDYKKAILLFYEQNNLTAFKQIFIEQNIFGVKNYFR